LKIGYLLIRSLAGPKEAKIKEREKEVRQLCQDTANFDRKFHSET